RRGDGAGHGSLEARLAPAQGGGCRRRDHLPRTPETRRGADSMSRIETLRRNYQRICGMPWDRNVAGPQRVWIAVYDKEDERKLRLRIGMFEEATLATGHRWHRCDLTDAFA